MPLHQGKAAALICRSYCGAGPEDNPSRQVDDLIRLIEQEKSQLEGEDARLHCWLEELCVVAAQLLYTTSSPRQKTEVRDHSTLGRGSCIADSPLVRNLGHRLFPSLDESAPTPLGSYAPPPSSLSGMRLLGEER